MKKKILLAMCVGLLLAGCGNAKDVEENDISGEVVNESEENAVAENIDAEDVDAENADAEKSESADAGGEDADPENQNQEAGQETEAQREPITYNLVWSDEFDGEEIDTTKWDFQYGTGNLYGVQFWGNNEEQYYTSREENARVEDGKLLITAIKEEERFKGMQYTSARMRTITNTGEVLYATTYGKIEARIKLPAGDGIWPAFWMLPADQTAYGAWAASGEIDIMEVRGRLPRVVNGTLHYGGAWPSNTYTNESYELPEDMDVTQFHNYSIEWEPDEIRWYVDDVCYFTMTSDEWYCNSIGEVKECADSAPFDVPFYILLNVAVGGNFDPEADMTDTVFPATMEVDYVRVYSSSAME